MLKAFLDGAACVVTVFIILALGYWFERLGWFRDKRDEILAQLVVKVGLPCTIFFSFVGSFTRSDLLSLGWGLGYPLIVVLLNIGLSAALCRVFRIREGRRSPFILAFTFSNAIFIGIPVALALFGDEAMPLTMLTFIVNTSLFWTVGYEMVRRESARMHGGPAPERETPVKRIARILQPATAAFIVSALFVLAGWTLPEFAMSAVRYMGNMVTPLSLIYSGAIIGRIGLRGLRPDRDVALVLLGRFLWAPAAAIGLSFLMPLPALTEKVVILQLAMSVQTQSTILVGLFGLDTPFMVKSFTLSALMTFAMIPIYVMLFQFLY